MCCRSLSSLIVLCPLTFFNLTKWKGLVILKHKSHESIYHLSFLNIIWSLHFHCINMVTWPSLHHHEPYISPSERTSWISLPLASWFHGSCDLTPIFQFLFLSTFKICLSLLLSPNCGLHWKIQPHQFSPSWFSQDTHSLLEVNHHCQGMTAGNLYWMLGALPWALGTYLQLAWRILLHG